MRFLSHSFEFVRFVGIHDGDICLVKGEPQGDYTWIEPAMEEQAIYRASCGCCIALETGHGAVQVEAGDYILYCDGLYVCEQAMFKKFVGDQ